MAEVLVQLDEEDLFVPVLPGEAIPLAGAGVMGIFTEKCSLSGVATLSYTYDDSLMRLIRIEASNHSGRGMVIEITSPGTYSKTLLDGESEDRVLTGPGRLAYQLIDMSSEKYLGKTVIGGIEWHAYLT